MIVIELPEPPSINSYWKRNRQGHIYKTTEAKEYCDTVRNLILADGIRAPETTEWVRVQFTWCRTLKDYKSKPINDLDNRQKCVFDACQGLLYVNDSKIAAIDAKQSISRRSSNYVVIGVQRACAPYDDEL